MDEFGFDTLLKENDLKYDERWSPHKVDNYMKLFKKGILEDMPVELCKNIAYSLQYLEFIIFEIKSLKLHSIVKTMLYKTFIIFSVSIIEAIFYYILKINNNLKTTDIEKFFSTKTNEKSFQGDKLIIEVNFYKQVEAVIQNMKLEEMIIKMEKHKYLNLNHKYYPFLKKYKNLRNKIHIYNTLNNSGETDYWKFNEEDFLFVRFMLLDLLLDEKITGITNEEKYKDIPIEYLFLHLNSSELKKLNFYVGQHK